MLTIEKVEDAVPLARALVAGGVRVLEVTLRTPVAVEAAKAVIAEVPDAIVGIGTILNGDDLARANALGAKFGISPGATPELLKAVAAGDLPVRPGDRYRLRADAGARPTASIWSSSSPPNRPAVSRHAGAGGAFPAYSGISPTGGIGEANAATWLAEPNVVAVGGSWICPAADIRSGNWAGITAMCERTMKLLKPA